jgi:hypothetical protein
MSRRKLLIGLACAALVSAGLGASVNPASGAMSVTVALPTGGTQTFTLDTCSSPIVGGTVVSCTPINVATPQAPLPQPQQQPQPNQGGGQTTTGTTPTEAPRPTGQPGRQPTKPVPPAPRPTVGTPGLGRPRPGDVRPGRLPNREVRARDGQPTLDNPTFSFAEPGPAPMGVPNFFIDKFRIPPFLLGIYQAAATEYNVPWQILCGINSIETDFGQNLNVSSAGALGWMQFIPSSWRAYGVDANNDGVKDPYNPGDAIFAAARYLKAAGAQKDLRRAIYAYNHADWYVDSVILRSKVICGLPADLVSSLTGLSDAHFPVAATATYADDLNEQRATRRVRPGSNAAVPVAAKSGRRSINIYSRKGAPVIAVNDGVIKAMGRNRKLGNYIVLQDVYGNRFTYSHLGRLAPSYPTLKEKPVDPRQLRTDSEGPPPDPTPSTPASAGQQRAQPRVSGPSRPSAARAASVKERLFAHPSRPRAYSAGGDQQLFDVGQTVSGSAFASYFQRMLGLRRDDVVLKRMKPGAQVIAGTILGRIDKLADSQLAPHVTFEIRPSGKGAPTVDPKPILDGWKLLEATAIYRAAGRNPFLKGATIGQILLMSKEALQRRVLADPRIEIYPCGRRDIQAGLIDKRVLGTIAYLSASGFKPYISSLKCEHSQFVAGGGMVSKHFYGAAVDIAKINGIPIMGHQGSGSITDLTIRQLLKLQGTMQPYQIISLMEYRGHSNTLAMGDHADHIHVGFLENYSSRAGASQLRAVLKPTQWLKLIQRIGQIDNPTVPTRPSRYSLPAGG